jgi:hypothetical protein
VRDSACDSDSLQRTQGASEFVLAQVACEDHYLYFQRALPIGSIEYWGILVEFDDQINSGYEKVMRCTLSRSHLKVEFTEPIDSEKRYKEAKIDLDLTEPEFRSFADGLRKVFTHKEVQLSMQIEGIW